MPVKSLRKSPARPTPVAARRIPGLPSTYPVFLNDLKARIRTAQIKAALAVNRELIALYWHIGKNIVQRQESEGWGRAIEDRLAMDLHGEFPEVAGFSPRNIWYMRTFYAAWTHATPNRSLPAHTGGQSILQQPVAELTGNPLQPVTAIPWGHNVLLLQKLKDPAARLWYARQTVAHGWSRHILALQIDSKLHLRQGRAVTNFRATLPAPQSDLAQQLLKDPYIFDFLTLGPAALERALETDLVNHITRFLLELGAGFAFVGRQFHLAVDGDDYYLDLLFYHVRLHCYLVLDLKAGPFKPEYAGKMNFYLSALDDLVRAPEDHPTIGLILCRGSKGITAEYALRDLAKPIGVAGWQATLTARLPKHLHGSLPTIRQLEQELAKRAPAAPLSHLRPANQ